MRLLDGLGPDVRRLQIEVPAVILDRCGLTVDGAWTRCSGEQTRPTTTLTSHLSTGISPAPACDGRCRLPTTARRRAVQQGADRHCRTQGRLSRVRRERDETGITVYGPMGAGVPEIRRPAAAGTQEGTVSRPFCYEPHLTDPPPERERLRPSIGLRSPTARTTPVPTRTRSRPPPPRTLPLAQPGEPARKQHAR